MQKAVIHAFAVEDEHSDLRQWVYLDECTVQLRDTGPIVWIMRGEPTPPHPISHLRAAIHVWGAAWWHGRSFTRYAGHLNGHTYTQLLNAQLLPHRDEMRRKWIAEDNAPYHNAATVKQWFADNNLRLLDWPPYAKKFNAIEYCWGWMKRTVKHQRPNTPAALCEAIDGAYTLLSQEILQHYILHAQKLLRKQARS